MTVLAKLAERHGDLKRSLLNDPRYQEMQTIEQTVRVVTRFEKPRNGTQALLEKMGLMPNDTTNRGVSIELMEPAAPASAATATAPAGKRGTRAKRSPMTAAQKRAVGARMKKYWAARRKAERT